MANEKPIQTRRELESHIVAQAWRDPKYKAKLLKNARGVVEEELKDLDPNVKLPDSLHVDVHEESPTQMHIVLPREPAPGVNEESLATLAPQTVAVVVTNISNVQLVVVASVIAYPPATNVTVGPVQAVVAAVNVLTNATTTSVA